MGIKLLHIGLPKCASKSLQTKIFPEIEKEKNIRRISISEIFNVHFHDDDFENNTHLKKNLPDNFIISDEGLFSERMEFSKISESFNKLKKVFSNDTTILLVLRNPYEFLNSIYAQKIQHNFIIIKPEEFFYSEKNSTRKDGSYNLYGFDYNFLISLYKSYFKKVIVVKLENFNKLSFLKEIFNVNDSFIEYLKQKKDKIDNKSISKTGIKTFLFLNKFIDLKKNQNFIISEIRKPTNKILYKIRNKILSQFYLEEFFRFKFDKIFPYKKYYINKDHILIDINKMIEDYNNMKFQIFNNLKIPSEIMRLLISKKNNKNYIFYELKLIELKYLYSLLYAKIQI